MRNRSRRSRSERLTKTEVRSCALPASGARPAGLGSSLDLDRLRDILAEIRLPARIGRACREGKDTGALLMEFAAVPGLRAAAAHSCPDAARAILRAQARKDFRRGDVVVTDRLVMARSECIIAALVA